MEGKVAEKVKVKVEWINGKVKEFSNENSTIYIGKDAIEIFLDKEEIIIPLATVAMVILQEDEKNENK